MKEIAAGRPICCCIHWPDNSGHFVVITGCDIENDIVIVKDPWKGNVAVMKYATLAFQYGGKSAGLWNWTYRTKREGESA